VDGLSTSSSSYALLLREVFDTKAAG